MNDVIEGVVLTFLDVTRIREAEQRALAAQLYAESIVETVREPLLVLDPDMRVNSANKAFYETFRVSEEETRRPRALRTRQPAMGYSRVAAPVDRRVARQEVRERLSGCA